MLEGKNINLRIMEKEDLRIVRDWVNTPQFVGVYEPITQETLAELEQQYDQTFRNGGQWFFTETKEGKKIGYMCHFLVASGDGATLTELGYLTIPTERGKGYGTEALTIMVDYLFLLKSIMRIQVKTDPQNLASQQILKKTGFMKEGIIRKSFFCRGKWRDSVLFSILREEWGKPKILTKTASQR